MSKSVRRWLMLGLCVLSLLTVSAKNLDYGDDEGTIRGTVFLDSNKNGKLDEGEKGVGWVYFTISQGDYTHDYYSEWQEKDEAGNMYATGTFGPAPLPMGYWNVTFHVPQEYVATTPAEQVIYVPGKAGGHVGYVNLGLYPKSGGAVDVLPQTGRIQNDPVPWIALAILGVGILFSTSLGLCSRRKSQ